MIEAMWGMELKGDSILEDRIETQVSHFLENCIESSPHLSKGDTF